MRRALLLVVALAWVPAGAAASPRIEIQAAPGTGAAPLAVTLTASEGASSYRWDFGDGSAAEGQVVHHVYAAGRYTATVTAAMPDGTVEAQTEVVAVGVVLGQPRHAVGYGHRLTLRGTVTPSGAGGVQIFRGETALGPKPVLRAGGVFVLTTRIRLPGAYTAHVGPAVSAPVAVTVKPQLVTSFHGTPTVGGRYELVVRLRPAGAGTVHVRVVRAGRTTLERVERGRPLRIRLATDRPRPFVIRVETEPAGGYLSVRRVLATRVVYPRLAAGASGASVAEAAARLRGLGYAAPSGGSFDDRLLDAVYAFQKVQGLPRTGTVDARFWAVLGRARRPSPRFASPAAHIEVDKRRQVLFVVHGARVALIVPVSTAGLPGKFTPVGTFAVYRKVAGFDPSPLGTLYDPLYFTGGYAIHGNPSVPPYPASHGCIRIPMWIAPLLFATVPYGETVDVY